MFDYDEPVTQMGREYLAWLRYVRDPRRVIIDEGWSIPARTWFTKVFDSCWRE